MAEVTVDTFIVTHKGRGLALSAPVAEPDAVALDEEELLLYLAEALAKVRPEVIAGHALPAQTHLTEVTVHAPTPLDGPVVELRLPCVVIPHGQVRWVIVLPLQHTVYVPARADLEAAVAESARRQIVALDTTGRAWLGVLPPRATELVAMAVPVAREGAKDRKARAARALDDAAAEVLDEVGKRVRPGDLPPLVGAERPFARLSGLLGGQQRVSALVVGESLSGKSALVRAWAAAHPDRRVYQLTGAALIAGMSGVGQWQARLQRVMEAARRLDAVLYFPRLADLFVDRPGGLVDLPSAIRPYLSEQRVRIVGEVDADRVDRLEARDVGFFARFVRVSVAPLDAAQTLRALAGRVEHDAGSGRPGLDAAARQTLVDLCVRYRPYRALPGKVIAEYEALTDGFGATRDARGTLADLDAEAVYAGFAERTGMPAFLLREDRALRLAATRATFARHIVGQEDAVAAVAETLCMVKARLQPGRKPLATYLFVGPTGVGKTEVARTLARFLFGTTERMVSFDMSEYGDAFAAERLIRGADGREGALTRHVRRTPFCVVLLDEIEKAHRAVFDLLLQVCGEGRLTDAAGRTTFFHNTIIILTSNLGARHKRPAMGLARADAADDAAYYRKAVEKHFRPEFVNRLDQVVPFRPLRVDEAEAVVRVALKRVCTRRGLVERGIQLDVSDAAVVKLAAEGYSPEYGGRALRRHLETALVTPLAGYLLTLSTPASRVTVTVGEGEGEDAERGLLFSSITHTGSRTVPHASMRALTDARRTVRRTLALDPIVELRESIEQIEGRLTQLAVPAAEAAGLQRRLADLRQRWDRLGALREQVEGLEELGLLAVRAGEPVESLAAEAKAATGDFDAFFVDAALARVPDRDSGWLLVQDLDDNMGLQSWLIPLLEITGSRGWRVALHVYGVKAEGWPSAIEYGPPMAVAPALDAMAASGRAGSAVVLRVVGPDAGALLSLERGRVHFEVDDASVDVRVLGRGALPDSMWAAPVLRPLTRKARAKRRMARPVRTVRQASVHLQLPDAGGAHLRLPAGEYWTRYSEIAAADLRLWLSCDKLVEDRMGLDWIPPVER